jgi:hypothetical protein
MSQTTPEPAATTAGNPFAKSLLETAQGNPLPLAKWGPVSVRPHVFYRVMQANGLLNPQQSEDDSSVVQTVSPGVLFEIGDSWTADYTYSHTFYSNRFFRDSVEHAASMVGTLRRKKWTIVATQRYSQTESQEIETGRQTPLKNYMADVDFTLRLGDRTQLSSVGTFGSRKVGDVSSNPLWTTSNWMSWNLSEDLSYEISSTIDVGAGYIFGYDSIKPGSDMSHSQPEGRLSWHPSNRLSFSAVAGIETRKFESGRGGKMDNPVYRATAQYAPFSTTKISLAGSRSFSASYFANWATRTSGWNSGLEQRLLKRFYLSLNYGELDAQYVFTNSALVPNRTDATRTAGARLTSSFLGVGSISLIYQNGKNSSTERDFSFVSNQYGAEISYRF